MPDINSLTSFSGLMVFFAVLAFLYRRHVVTAVLLIVAGAAGTGIVWDRWSERAGDQVHFGAFLDPTTPKSDEIAMISTHLPLLVLGLALLTYSVMRKRQEEESPE